MLKIQNLSVSYGSRRVLHDVSFDVQSGEVLALIGPNGAGKSTLIRAVSGVIPYAGQIRTNGDDFAALSTLQRAKYIATVPQAVALPPAYTVWETVLFGRTPHLGFLGQPSHKDEEIARHLREALASGELAGTEGFGKPLPEDAGWNATPESLRMPFKILKNAGFVPAEVELLHERAALSAALKVCDSEPERVELRRKLSDLEQKIALRLEALRINGSI